MKQWKRTGSVRIRQWFLTTLVADGRKLGDSPIWQAKYYSFNMYDCRKMEEEPNYMDQNRVRAAVGPGSRRGTTSRRGRLA
jgi:hypothetical protein